LLLLGLMLGAAPLAAREPLFLISDPRGDDHGDGSLVYPLRPDMEPGDLDLVELAAYPEPGGTAFRVTLGRAVREPGRVAVDSVGTQLATLARHGFYTFNLDLYIDIDREPGSGRVDTLPGRKVEIAPEDAWEKVVVLSPTPFEAKGELRQEMLEAWKRQRIEEHASFDDRAVRRRREQIGEELRSLVYFPARVRVTGPHVEFFVPGWFLAGGAARPEWGYVAFVTGARLGRKVKLPFFHRWQEDFPGLVMPVEPGRPENAFGGGRPGDALQPPVVDLFTPPGRSQEEILFSYDPAASRPAQLPAVVPRETARSAPPDR
jgi:hypothetical protein